MSHGSYSGIKRKFLSRNTLKILKYIMDNLRLILTFVCFVNNLYFIKSFVLNELLMDVEQMGETFEFPKNFNVSSKENDSYKKEFDQLTLKMRSSNLKKKTSKHIRINSILYNQMKSAGLLKVIKTRRFRRLLSNTDFILNYLEKIIFGF